ncbi:MAG TPA: phosphate ABC transporter permease [Verrucomicrobiales bacterium]|nr:phosphate ABC transporter permease [Verrucomicrobiales bacterium]
MPHLIIEAGRSEAHYWCDIYRYKDLFFFLAWRDLLVRYKQTVVGVLWAVLRPLLTMLIFVAIFSRVAGLHSKDMPYSILVLSGMLPWQFFATALSESSSSLITNANLITKIYFPRIILPASSVIVALVDFLITLCLLAAVMLWCQFLPSWRIIFLPVFILLALVAALGPGLMITALNVQYRDFRYIIPFVVQFGLYISPVGFSSAVVGEKFGALAHVLYSLNPMVGVIDGFRWCLGDGTSFDGGTFTVSVVISLVFLATGIRYFRKTEKSFADII